MKFYRSFALLCLTLAPLAAQVTLNPNPTRVIGQPSVQLSPTNLNPNLVEGRELYSPQAVAIDSTLSPPGLYVSDAGNNRVLGFRNATAFANGQHADIVIGQPDFFTTIAQGPNRQGSTRPSSGLFVPSGLAVDGAGNLYVVDAGNNRILRFPKPFSQTDQLPDMVIGQQGFSGNSPNGGGAASASTLFFASGGSVSQAYITFDNNGNLWVADAGNNRILRFNGAALASGASGLSADLVLGQPDFVTTTFNPTGNRFLSLNAIQAPTGIAVDPGGRVLVSESVAGVQGRVLVFTPPFTNGKPATRQLGVPTTAPAPPPVSEFAYQAAPAAVFMIGGNPAVVDRLNSRILIYKPIDQWSPDLNTQPAAAVVGQADFAGAQRNRGQPEPSANTLNLPVAAVSFGSELFVADTGNNRVLVMPANGANFSPATRVLGQDQMYQSAINLIEGREFQFYNGQAADAGITVDLNSNPPHLYVADTYNHRILCYNDVRNVKPGDRADLVIGQPDFGRSVANYPANDPAKPTATSLFLPIGVTVDAAGNLYVADTGNSRVVRYPAPFVRGQNMPAADLVLGQRSFTATKITDPSAATMSSPYGVAISVNGGLWVSDTAHNRVLFFSGNSSTFVSGMAATKVIGQPDFGSAAAGGDDNRLSGPHHIATDTDDRLYVADTGNNRVSIFDRAPSAGPDPHAAVLLPSLNTPRGIYVSASTGEIWVTDTGNNRALRYPRFDLLAVSLFAPNAFIPEISPRAVTLDSFGDLYVADLANRIAIHFPGIATLNGANFLPRALAPNTVVSLFSRGARFGNDTLSAPTLPLPNSLNNIQVQINGKPVPLYFVSPEQINFLMPNGAPTSGTADLLVLRTDTGQVLGSGPVPMAPVSPGIFTIPPVGSGQGAVVNVDGTVNSQTNPAVVGTIISIYGTGEGFIPDAPPDGAAPGKALSTPERPRVSIGVNFVPDANVTYSGLQPDFPGLWQINVKIPDDVAPSAANNLTYITVFMSSIANGDPTRRVNIWVKQK